MNKVQIQNEKEKGTTSAQRTTPVQFWIGLPFILISIAASGMLVLEHLIGMTLPGCGVGSGCAKAAASVWGTAPGINVPTSSVGLAYFLAIAIGWVIWRGRVAPAFKWIVRLGALISIGFLAIIVIEKHFCIYCLAAHAGNLVFWLCVECVAPLPRRSLPALATLAASFAGAVAILAAVESINKENIRQRHERELTESTRNIINKHAATEPDDHSQDDHTQDVYSPPGGFTGRNRYGPENAPIRLVIFSDYQCPDCKKVEAEVRQLLATRSDISLSAKQFPMCSDCNAHVPVRMHQNACWAARAAETAGTLYGNDGFWKMHFWLFDHDGFFETRQDLEAGLQACGFDPQRFLPALEDEHSLDNIKQDVEEGYLLGLYFTPMIFINGVELRGFISNPGAITRAVEAIAASHPRPGTAMDDHPPVAAGKYIGDWREQPIRAMPPESRTWSLGSENAPVKIVIWTDYAFPLTAQFDRMVRQQMERRGDIQYTFRHYPANPMCNPSIKENSSPAGCWAAQAAEAAGQLAGAEGRWKMHDWLLNNQSQLRDDALRTAAPSMGFDPDKLLAAMKSPEVLRAVSEDIAVGHSMIVQGIPTIYVNGKWVPRWRLKNGDTEEPIMERIIEEAAKR